jgi:Reverse transcriptase (RNA-dependent DNA polymerase)
MNQFLIPDDRKIPQQMAHLLSRTPDESEIRHAVFQLGPDKAPGPDGLTARFIQQNWEVLKPDISKIIKRAFLTSQAPPEWTTCHIVLIPKANETNTPKDFRPISIGNILYRLVAKIITNRLLPHMSRIVSPAQTAFIRGRSITDNTILMKEVLHSYNLNTYTDESFALKADINKAFDSVEWAFIEHGLRKINVPESLNKLIVSCLRSSKITVLINGKGDGFFQPTRGLRQGCPLSPYLFIISMEFFTKAMDRALQEARIQGIKVARSAPILTHALYADDLVVFARANGNEVHQLQTILQEFGQVSGLQLNPNKSTIWFSKSCSDQSKHEVLSKLQAKLAKEEERYLGIMVKQKARSGDHTDKLLEEKFQISFAGWKINTLSPSGRLVLIKSSLISIPVYYMSCCHIPTKTVTKLTSLLRKFFWGKLDKQRYLAMISWEKICLPFEEGGLDVKDLRTMNNALLLKLVWQVASGQDRQWVGLMRAKYCDSEEFWSNHSTTGVSPL